MPAKSKTKGKARLCFVGPMLGRNPGWVVSQGEILADLFAREGYTVRLTSRITSRTRRLLDTVRSLVAWRNEIDIVVLTVFSGPAFAMADLASLVAKWIRKPLVLYLRGGDLPEFTDRHSHWVERVLRRGNAVVSPSDYLAHTFRQRGFHVDVIPNVLEIERYPYRNRPHVQPRLLWMRTFHDLYQPGMALDVLEQLQSAYPDATLSMAGQDQGLLGHVKQRAEHKGLSGRVRFPGFLDMEGKRREFADHDIFLNTNQVDNMPVSILEAAAFGLPVVATGVGGIPYLVEHEKTALLVEEGDVAGMVQAVSRLLGEPGLAARLSTNGRQLAEGCAWSQVLGCWEALIDRVLLAS